MPEGDTIFRTAANVSRWMQGRQVTAAESRVARVHLAGVVGARIDAVEARGKRYTVADWLSPDEIAAAKRALLEHLRGERSARYVM